MISSEQRFVYVVVPKAACGTLKDAIARHFGYCESDEQYILWRKGVLPEVDLEDCAVNGYFRFAFVRNPFARLVSAFYGIVLSENREYEDAALSLLGSRLGKMRKKVLPIRKAVGKELGEPLTFSDFAHYTSCTADDQMNVHWRPQHTFLSRRTNAGREILVDFIGKVEQIQSGWACLASLFHFPCDLRHKNRTEHPPWRSCYSEETWEIVRERYKEDIWLFGYQAEASLGPAAEV